MKRLSNVLILLALAATVVFSSCGNEGNKRGENKTGKSGSDAAGAEGIVLMIAEADLIEVEGNPEYNTAEWLFRVDKPGRYDVWLSSLTLDPAQLDYSDDVVITAGETRLAKKPVSDKVVTGDRSVTEPWQRADTHMGSVFFSKPGEYPVQVISDRVEPHGTDLSQLKLEEHTIVNSVILRPKVN